MRKIVLLSIFIFCTLYLFAQSRPAGSGAPRVGIILGQIIDEDNENVLEYANVMIFYQKDSSMVTGGISNGEGKFRIENLPYGNFYLVANFIGYEKEIVEGLKITPQKKSIDVGEISLPEASTQLDNVEITAERSAVEYHIDKKVVNVEQDLVSTGGSAVNVLENVPSVRVDIEGNVSLRGSSNFTVFIDGRPTVLSGSDALQQIPASSIKSIEIITNPSAKYDPDGVGGIINVILKKQSKTGLNGLVNASIGVREKYTADALLNYKAGKFNFFAGANWNDQSFISKRKSERETFLSNRTEFVNTAGDGVRRRRGYDFKAGFDYYLSDLQTLSFSGNIGYNAFGSESDNFQTTFSSIDPEEEYTMNISDGLRDGDFYSLNFNFQNKFNEKGHELSFLSFYSFEKGGDYDSNDEFLADSNGDIIDDQPYRVETNEDGSSNQFRFQTDYTNPFENGKFEAGFSYRYDDDQEDFTFEEFEPEIGQWVSNQNFENANEFKRNIFAGYLIFSNKLLGFDYQVGLRGEYTDRTVTTQSDPQPFVIDRLDYFPTFHLTKDISKTDQIQGGYSRRINRPRGYYLEPFVSFMNRFMYRRGNPDLQPEYVNSFELNYQKRFGVSFISLETYYRETLNAFTRVLSIYDTAQNITLMEFANVNNETSLGTELMLNWEVNDWLRLNASANLYRFQLEGNISDQDVANQSTNYDFRLNSTVSLSESTRLQLIGFYQGPSATAQGDRDGFYMINGAVRQELFNQKLTATFQARDIFGSMKFNIRSQGKDFRSYYMYQREPRVFTLTLSYKINNFKQDNGRRGENGGNMNMDMGDDF